jgi:hypothetical protein
LVVLSPGDIQHHRPLEDKEESAYHSGQCEWHYQTWQVSNFFFFPLSVFVVVKFRCMCSIEQLVFFFFFFVVAMAWSRIFPLRVNLMLNLALGIILEPENENFLLFRVMYSLLFQFDLLGVFFGRK